MKSRKVKIILIALALVFIVFLMGNAISNKVNQNSLEKIKITLYLDEKLVKKVELLPKDNKSLNELLLENKEYDEVYEILANYFKDKYDVKRVELNKYITVKSFNGTEYPNKNEEPIIIEETEEIEDDL